MRRRPRSTRSRSGKTDPVASPENVHDEAAEENRRVVAFATRGEPKAGLTEALRVQRLAIQRLSRTDPERAKAICNLGYFQQANGDRRAALATYRRGIAEMAIACGKTSRFYGRALVQLASLLIELNRLKDAESTLVAAVWARSHAPDRDEEEVAQSLRDLVGLHQMMAKSDSLSRKAQIAFAKINDGCLQFQLQRNPTIQSGLQEIKKFSGYSPSQRKAAADDTVSLMRRISQDEDYSEAWKIIWRHDNFGEPFALLLRAFRGEAFTKVLRAPGGSDASNDVQIASVSRAVGEVEARLYDEFKETIPALTVAAPGALVPGNAAKGGHMPRLVLGDREWHAVVQSLIHEAHLIVVDALDITAGVEDELEMVTRAGRCESTVVLLHRGRSVFRPKPSALTLQSGIFSSGKERPGPVEEPLTAQHTILARFPSVAYSEDLKTQNSASKRLFGQFLSTIPMARSASRLDLTGRRLGNSGRMEDARRYFWSSIGVGSALRRWSPRPAVLWNYAVVCSELGDIQDSIEAYESCRAAAHDLHNDPYEGRSLVMKGAEQLKVGHSEEGLASVWASLGPLERIGDNIYVGIALETLMKGYIVAGDKAGAAAARKELQRWQKASRWRLVDACTAFRHRASAPVPASPDVAAKASGAGRVALRRKSTKPARLPGRVRATIRPTQLP